MREKGPARHVVSIRSDVFEDFLTAGKEAVHALLACQAKGFRFLRFNLQRGGQFFSLVPHERVDGRLCIGGKLGGGGKALDLVREELDAVFVFRLHRLCVRQRAANGGEFVACPDKLVARLDEFVLDVFDVCRGFCLSLGERVLQSLRFLPCIG